MKFIDVKDASIRIFRVSKCVVEIVTGSPHGCGWMQPVRADTENCDFYV